MSESVEAFRSRAESWLRDNASHAPRDYGAICPPHLIDAGKAWQIRLHAAGFTGIHWPVEHGGQGLTSAHTATWIELCALHGVPPVLNMVGLVLAGGSIMKFGTPEQQSQHLLQSLAAEHVWC